MQLFSVKAITTMCPAQRPAMATHQAEADFAEFIAAAKMQSAGLDIRDAAEITDEFCPDLIDDADRDMEQPLLEAGQDAMELFSFVAPDSCEPPRYATADSMLGAEGAVSPQERDEPDPASGPMEEPATKWGQIEPGANAVMLMPPPARPVAHEAGLIGDFAGTGSFRPHSVVSGMGDNALPVAHAAEAVQHVGTTRTALPPGPGTVTLEQANQPSPVTQVFKTAADHAAGGSAQRTRPSHNVQPQPGNAAGSPANVAEVSRAGPVELAATDNPNSERSGSAVPDSQVVIHVAERQLRAGGQNLPKPDWDDLAPVTAAASNGDTSREAVGPSRVHPLIMAAASRPPIDQRGGYPENERPQALTAEATGPVAKHGEIILRTRGTGPVTDADPTPAQPTSMAAPAELVPPASATNEVSAPTVNPDVAPLRGNQSHPDIMNAPRHLPPAEPHRQIADAIVRTRDGNVEIILDPIELGRVTVMLGTDGSQALGVLAERPETLDLIRRHSDQLLRDLRDNGMPEARLDFLRQDGRSRDGQGGQHPAPGQNGRPDARSNDSPTATPTSAAPTANGINRIDIRL